MMSDDLIREAAEREDWDEVYERCKPLAEAGQLDAQVYLGWMFLQGKGVDKSDTQASRWLSAAADKGSGEANYYLGVLATRRKDGTSAVRLFEQAAARGFSPAYYRLGLLYERGNILQKDVDRATALYRKGAEARHVFAMKRLSLILRSGRFGFWQRFAGILLIIKAIVIATGTASRDPYSERLRE